MMPAGKPSLSQALWRVTDVSTPGKAKQLREVFHEGCGEIRQRECWSIISARTRRETRKMRHELRRDLNAAAIEWVATDQEMMRPKKLAEIIQWRVRRNNDSLSSTFLQVRCFDEGYGGRNADRERESRRRAQGSRAWDLLYHIAFPHYDEIKYRNYSLFSTDK